MKTMNKIFPILMAGAVLAFTSCVDEEFPESSTATADQVAQSPAGLAGALGGMATAMSQGYYVYGRQTHETDMAYPAYMIAQTEMLSDMFPLGANSGYDWYRSYNVGSQTGSFGSNTYFAYLPWFTFYKLIKTDNDVIAPVDLEADNSPETLRFVGSAYAARAFHYYMLTVLFEPIANSFTDCSKVLGSNPPSTALTVVKVLPETDPASAKENPRMTHAEVTELMLSDLAIAEKCLTGNDTKDGTVPGLAAVYAIMAKVHMWDCNWSAAAECARKAIEVNGGAPMSQSEWLDKNSAFTTATSGWMWYLQYSVENMGNLCNFVGWMSGEADWGYSSLTNPSINAWLYNYMGENDFRRGAWLDPDRSKTLKWYGGKYDKMSVRDQGFIDDAPDYLGLKFRCLGGDWENYSVGGAIQVPVLRVDEMYFIEALAKGMQDLNAGVSLLNSFMSTYRDPGYNFSAASTEEFKDEVITQMRIEFWGEGNAFPLAKRMGADVICNYEGTNAPADIFKCNFKGFKPIWTLCIPDFETQSNQVLQDTNNPNPSQVTTYPTPVGEWAVKN